MSDITGGITPDYRRMNDLLALSSVPRWAIVKTTHPQSVADHSYRVAMIALELMARTFAHAPVDQDSRMVGRILLWALVHDGPESHSGDMPGIAKRTEFAVSTSGLSATMGGIYRHYERHVCPWLDQFNAGAAFAGDPDYASNRQVYRIVKMADLIECTAWIWVHKQGAHAERVWRYLLNQMELQIAEFSTEFGWLASEARTLLILPLYNDVCSERGRLDNPTLISSTEGV